MGNCIHLQNKVLQMGQKVTVHKEPISVDQVLSDLLPVPFPVEFNKNQEIKAGSESNNGVVRIKVVITKQELGLMLKKGGVSIGELVSHMKNENSNKSMVIEDEDEDEDDRNCRRWKPELDTIPEFN
ncbi:uncharacterized protein [Rutidosis leptorrhynchoides]|uniref:uncharacterized protein n=1 Tax=Rutidosis leptorrhynchoides TaxID=125765 RepID=UPI003A99D321